MKIDIMPAISPMIDQYYAIKSRLPSGSILALRLGDFLEFFGDDAKTVARLLNITLTNRKGHPMSGVPYYAAEKYLAQITAAGHAVTVAEIDNKSGKVALT